MDDVLIGVLFMVLGAYVSLAAALWFDYRQHPDE